MLHHPGMTSQSFHSVPHQSPSPTTGNNNVLGESPTTCGPPKRFTTPIKKSSRLDRQFSTLTRYRDPTLNAIAEQMTSCIVGPMPIADFLEMFLPTSLIPRYKLSTAGGFQPGAFKTCIGAEDELGMYKPFVSNALANFFAIRFICVA